MGTATRAVLIIATIVASAGIAAGATIDLAYGGEYDHDPATRPWWTPHTQQPAPPAIWSYTSHWPASPVCASPAFGAPIGSPADAALATPIGSPAGAACVAPAVFASAATAGSYGSMAVQREAPGGTPVAAGPVAERRPASVRVFGIEDIAPSESAQSPVAEPVTAVLLMLVGLVFTRPFARR